jgi:adenylosuccinate lyase
MQHLAIRVIRGLVVHEDRMRHNLEITHGALFSQRVLLALVEQGLSRDEAYRIVQEDAQRAWDTGTPLRELLAARELHVELDLDELFDLAHYTRYAARIVGRLDAFAPAPVER